DRAGDRSRGAADHADGIGALVARSRDEPVLELEPLPDEPRDPPVRVGARPYAVVAAGARVQVDHQDALAVDQSGLHRHLEILGPDRVPDRVSAPLQRLERASPERGPHRGAGAEQLVEGPAVDLHELDAVDRREREGPGLVEKERRLPEVVPLAEVRQRQVRRSGPGRDLYVTAPYQVERIGGRALLHDELAGLEGHELHTLFELA